MIFICKENPLEMEGLLLIFLILLLPLSSSENLPECGRNRQRSATPRISQENAFLSGHVVKVVTTKSFLQCGQQCLKHSWCISVNFKLDDGRCELNDFGVSRTAGGKLIHRPGFVYCQFGSLLEVSSVLSFVFNVER